ncbi:hypothetical protein ACRAWC_24985 [Leifsonia sp. L25]
MLPDAIGSAWELELSSDPELSLGDGGSVILGESSFALLRSRNS